MSKGCVIGMQSALQSFKHWRLGPWCDDIDVVGDFEDWTYMGPLGHGCAAQETDVTQRALCAKGVGWLQKTRAPSVTPTYCGALRLSLEFAQMVLLLPTMLTRALLPGGSEWSLIGCWE